VQVVGSELQDLDGAPAHAVAAPAEDHGVDPPGEEPLDQYLSLTTMQKPANNETHEPAEVITHPTTNQSEAC